MDKTLAGQIIQGLLPYIIVIIALLVIAVVLIFLAKRSSDSAVGYCNSIMSQLKRMSDEGKK